MIGKVKNLEEALNGIEAIDMTIREILNNDSRKYGDILILMQKRLVFISEMNRLKADAQLTAQTKARIKTIFDSAGDLQELVKAKRDKIRVRLDKNRKLEIQNKKLEY